MTDLSASSAAQQVLPAAPPRRPSVRRGPVTAVGLLAAVALGGGVLFLPGDSPASADQLTTVALVQRPAHPVQPVVPVTAATASPAPAAVQFRNPFRPLVTDDKQQAPPVVPDTTVGSPEGGTPVTDPAPTFELPQAPVTPPPPPDTSTGSPAAGGESLVGRRLSLTAVDTEGDGFVAVLSLDGTPIRAAVGASFGPGGELLLLSLQQGPADGQWTAVVQRGRGEPFDVVTGSPVRLP